MINGDWNGKGTLFIDYRCKKPFNEFNTIIYGHRMRDGSMVCVAANFGGGYISSVTE